MPFAPVSYISGVGSVIDAIVTAPSSTAAGQEDTALIRIRSVQMFVRAGEIQAIHDIRPFRLVDGIHLDGIVRVPCGTCLRIIHAAVFRKVEIYAKPNPASN